MLQRNQLLLDSTLTRVEAEIAAEERKRQAILNTSQIIEQVVEFGAKAFSSGLAAAIVDVASGIEKANEAFKQFAANFLRLTAEMILQQLILNALRSGFPSVFASQGVVVASAAARGGVFPKMMAAGGVEGAMALTQPTYFPKFNTLGAEAGFEIAAFLAKPQHRQLGGIDAIVGNAGATRVALANAADLEGTRVPGGRVVLHVQANVDPRVNLQFQADAADLAVQKVIEKVDQDGIKPSAFPSTCEARDTES